MQVVVSKEMGAMKKLYKPNWKKVNKSEMVNLPANIH